ncbi:MAG: transglutaminase domain-containing protein, partial [Ardenticatenaceae bacterium]|nr:transglutaminase domain-containing protein [Ardenticatenaceae bacterium]
MAGLLTGVMYYTSLEAEWQANEVDYSTEIRTDLAVYAGVISVALLVVALLLPSFSLTRLADFFRQQAVVQQAEAALTRAFGGVRQPGAGGFGPSGGGSGVMPRSYLLGNAPELSETVVMTAVVSTPLPAHASHWRGLSYDVYTGRGWASSEGRQEHFAAGVELPLSPVTGQTVLEQSVYWLLDDRVIRYTLGLPRQFDQEVVVTWRGLTDLVWVQSEAGRSYRAVSQLTTATVAQMQTAVGEVPAVIQQRYTQLPDDLPERVRELAQAVAGGEATPLAQALALQTFLRQYRYSLDVPLPPRAVDPVAFFLFEQQAGYCDYFASAMTVMARSLGLPARLVVGYRAQPPDAAGVQTIRQIDAHSWTEIYLADVGWVEFEPTAVFAAPGWAEVEMLPGVQVTRDGLLPEPMPIPEADVSFAWGRLLVVGLLVVGLLVVGWRQRGPPTGGVVWVFGRLQRQAVYVGQLVRPSQTPMEFAEGMVARLAVFARWGWLREMVARLGPSVRLLAGLFNGRQYGRAGGGDEVALEVWQGLQRPLWLLRVVQWVKRP